MLEIPQNIKELFEKSIIAFGTVDKEGCPNVIAVACCRVVSPNQVLITDNFLNKTRRNLSQNPNVSLAFWNIEQSLDGVGYQFKGTAEVKTDGEWKQVVDSMETNQGLAHKAAILVTVTEIWDLATPKLLARE
jgi:predicted pyridoxine 5'-phosphate oxidase superfamily flavin-nucleotide-binding protein